MNFFVSHMIDGCSRRMPLLNPTLIIICHSILNFRTCALKKGRIANRVLFQITFYSVHIIFSNCLEQVKESMKTDRERKKENRNEESADFSFLSLVLSSSQVRKFRQENTTREYTLLLFLTNRVCLTEHFNRKFTT